MPPDISQPTSQLTVHLIEPAAMTWAVVRENEHIHEGSFQSCEAFLDWHENSLNCRETATETSVRRDSARHQASRERDAGDWPP